MQVLDRETPGCAPVGLPQVRSIDALMSHDRFNGWASADQLR
jgi:hypothetical protein